ncbi:MAG TPA: F0F1 ATP synthase subunit gamma [Rhodospirillaceae bacterium]|jgi:F-type H+-transporting ATPase subunit gamma|nr:F0F1 ATP synthase subunit gamma [Alphaproteobacteria bacterium]HBH26144.1 F0F1 ATP synthase subunit gamma [Rhodospirillaceae bacterium]
MPSLRDYRDRISSVKSTRKITSAMKMVAASKLRKMQQQEEDARPYATQMAVMLRRILGTVGVGPASPRLLIGTGTDKRYLLIVVTGDRGLCGGFNANVIRMAKTRTRDLEAKGHEVRIMCVGRKGHDALRRIYGPQIVSHFTGVTGRTRVTFGDVRRITVEILDRFDGGEFDICEVVYSDFKSLLVQEPDVAQLIPFQMDHMVDTGTKEPSAPQESVAVPYNFEPEKQHHFEALLQRNIGVQVFRALLESAAGEQAARMTAMDGATKNAGEMIDKLTLYYNRARQAHITKELIEIISGAEAV